jgi:hypothetical protein
MNCGKLFVKTNFLNGFYFYSSLIWPIRGNGKQFVEPLYLRKRRQHCTIYQDCKYKQPHKICYCLTGLGKNCKCISIACSLNIA